MSAARAKPVRPKIVPDDADVYDRLQEERDKDEWGCYSRTARAFGVSPQHIRNVEARYIPAPELVYLPPPDAYPEPVAPFIELATEAVLQDETDNEPATELTTDSQHVMSSSAQLATDELAMLQFLSVNSAVLAYRNELLQLLPPVQSRIDDTTWLGIVVLPVGLMTLVNAWKIVSTFGLHPVLAPVAFGLAACGLVLMRLSTSILDDTWPLWRGWLVVAGLAALVVALGVLTL